MIWFDGVHMASDVSIEELLEQAEIMGIRLKRMHKSKIPHFDILGSNLSKVKKNCSSKDLVRKCRDAYR